MNKIFVIAAVAMAMANPIDAQARTRSSGWSGLVTGAAIGAGATYLMTRPSNANAAPATSQEQLNAAVLACKNARGNYDFNRNLCVTN